MNLPLSELRRRIDDAPRRRELWVYCAAGQRTYFAQRLLMQLGLDAKNLLRRIHDVHDDARGRTTL